MRKGIVVTPSDFKDANWPEMMRRFSLNTLGLHSGGGARHDVIAALGSTMSETFISDLKSMQLDYEYELHVVDELLDRKLFSEHPDYFICREGARCEAGNWCVSNTDAMKHIGDNVAELAVRLAPSTHRYFFWGEDAAASWCHCDACAALTPADQGLLCANRQAEAVRRVDPQGQTAFLAYLSTFAVPSEVKPCKGVFLEYAPIQRCYFHAIDDPRCSINRQCWQTLLGLLEIFPVETAHVLEYWLDVSRFSSWSKPVRLPPVTREIMRCDLAAYHGLGIRSITTFAVYMDGAFFSQYGDRLLLDYAELINDL